MINLMVNHMIITILTMLIIMRLLWLEIYDSGSSILTIIMLNHQSCQWLKIDD